MPAPLEYRKFKKMVESLGCVIEESRLPHYGVVLYQGRRVSTFSVTHGGRTKGNEVKPAYIKAFEKRFGRIEDE